MGRHLRKEPLGQEFLLRGHHGQPAHVCLDLSRQGLLALCSQQVCGHLPVRYKAIARGQTLGKMAMKIKVVRPDGTDISGGQAWGREVARLVLGFLYIVDPLPALFTKDRRTVHDMLAGTRVVNWNT